MSNLSILSAAALATLVSLSCVPVAAAQPVAPAPAALSSAPAGAERQEQQDGRQKMLGRIKAEAREAIHRRIGLLTEEDACIAGASDRPALRDCRKKTQEDMKAEMERERDAIKGLQEERRDP